MPLNRVIVNWRNKLLYFIQLIAARVATTVIESLYNDNTKS